MPSNGHGIDRRTFLGLAAAGTLSLAAGGAAARGAGRTVATQGGLLRGAASGTNGVTAWLGVPYAAPPVGPLRWRPPQPAAPWTGTRAATAFTNSPVASAMSRNSVFYRNDIQMGEDCLSVNVWAPEGAQVGSLPVMVWIYGGAFVWGTSDDTAYRGDRMASEGVVFVSFNYRVGVLGFFAHPELSAESTDGVSGNYGLLDQIAALRWVQRNIAGFGGNPHCVTILGQSAGAFSVGLHLAMPGSRGLFHRGIVQSGAPLGAPSSFIRLGELKSMEKDGQDLAGEVRAKNLQALRAMSASALVEANSQTWRFYPAIDGRYLPEHPYRIMTRGQHNDVPLIAGFNANEGGVFRSLGAEGPAALRASIEESYGAETAAAVKLFPASSTAEAQSQGHQLFADIVFNWNTAALLALQAKYGRSAAYGYHFAYAPAYQAGRRFDEGAADELGAYHGAEIPYVLNTVPESAGAADHALSQALRRCWQRFAGQGLPGAAQGSNWDRFALASSQVLHVRSTGCVMAPLPLVERLRVLGHAMGLGILDEARAENS